MEENCAPKKKPQTGTMEFEIFEEEPAFRQANKVSSRQERIDKMCSQRERGLTLQEIGENFGVSRERVRQLLAPFPDLTPLAIEARSEQKIKTHEDKIWQILTSSPSVDAAFRKVHNNADVILQFPELDPTLLHTYLKDRFWNLPKVQAKSIQWTDEEILSSLQSASSLSTGTLSKGEYDRWRESTEHAPSVPTITNRFGKWNAAVSAAGLQVTVRRKNYDKRWTDESILRVLRRFISDQQPANGSLKLVKFREWLIEQPRDSVPSLALVRQYVRRHSSNWAETISDLSEAI